MYFVSCYVYRVMRYVRECRPMVRLWSPKPGIQVRILALPFQKITPLSEVILIQWK